LFASDYFYMSCSPAELVPASPVLQNFEICYELVCRPSRRAPMTGPTAVRLGAVVSLWGLSSPSPPKLRRKRIRTEHHSSMHACGPTTGGRRVHRCPRTANTTTSSSAKTRTTEKNDRGRKADRSFVCAVASNPLAFIVRHSCIRVISGVCRR
jgi:hypothetical protein